MLIVKPIMRPKTNKPPPYRAHTRGLSLPEGTGRLIVLGIRMSMSRSSHMFRAVVPATARNTEKNTFNNKERVVEKPTETKKEIMHVIINSVVCFGFITS